jgi:hypothetical protein
MKGLFAKPVSVGELISGANDILRNNSQSLEKYTEQTSHLIIV